MPPLLAGQHQHYTVRQEAQDWQEPAVHLALMDRKHASEGRQSQSHTTSWVTGSPKNRRAMYTSSLSPTMATRSRPQ